jgi:hypothetical protein
MFLEEDELGISAWGGAKTGYQSDSDIISYLGCAVIRFTDEIVSGGPEITKTSEFPQTGDPLHPVATGSLQILKTDSSTGSALDGATFTLYDSDGKAVISGTTGGKGVAGDLTISYIFL